MSSFPHFHFRLPPPRPLILAHSPTDPLQPRSHRLEDPLPHRERRRRRHHRPPPRPHVPHHGQPDAQGAPAVAPRRRPRVDRRDWAVGVGGAAVYHGRAVVEVWDWVVAAVVSVIAALW